MDRVCDALIVMLPFRESLASWHARGLLEREAVLWHAMRAGVGALIVASGEAHPGDDAAVRAVDPNGDIAFVTGFAPRAADGRLVRELLGRFGVGANVVIRTCQMSAGPLALAAGDQLRERGMDVRLIARAGHIWSRRLAIERGPDDPRTAEAGRIERELCRAAGLIVGTTGKQVDELAWRFGLAEERLRVVPNFVPTDEPPTGSDERDPATILCVGPFVGRKRMDSLVRSVASIDDEARDRVRLLLIGDGPERASACDLAAGLGVRLEAPGWVAWSEVREAMRRATIYADASTHEWHPRAVIEAMAAGCPIVTNDAAGLGGLVQNGATGVRIPDDIADSFSSAFLGLLEDPEWCEMLGMNAARVTRAAFGVEEVARSELGVIAEACATGGRSLAA
ncbi:MAG: glycosyltransferase family 4 protein [Phycisphaerales bacterium]|jgi:glycosyltransferase involved in cell wall biosynthesis|nr:glycosyltransferase family 4 protein [Phycisphaerales bacterium]